VSTTEATLDDTRPEPICAIETITPELAKQMLSINHANRRLIDSGVERIMGIIARGEWMSDSTDAIGLDYDGGVINGQHRLTAIAQGTTTVRALVLRNVNPDVIKVIDQGQPRNLAQILQMSGKYEYAGDLAVAIQYLWCIYQDREKTLPAAVRPSIPQLLEFFGQHPHLPDSVRVAVDVSRGVGGIQRAKLASFHYLMATVDSELADDFFSKLETGADIQPGDPVHALREKVNANAAATKPEGPVTVLAWVVKAWEAQRAGKALQKATLKWQSKGARAEDFPKVSDIAFTEDGALDLGVVTAAA
jgi:hypothetical protein